MATDFYTLEEFAEIVTEIAENWEGEEAAIMVGDLTGNLDVSKKDGYVQHGNVGYATEGLRDSPVFTLGQEVDKRFYGTMLVRLSKLSDEAKDALRDRMEVAVDGS